MIGPLGFLAKALPLKKVGELVIGALGLGKGKLSEVSVVGLVAGVVGTGVVTDVGAIVEMLKQLLDLFEKAWPIVVPLVGLVGGLFRKAGAALPPEGPKVG